MATTSYGTPYVQSSDLVSGWPNASLNVADRIDAVSYSGNGLNAQTGTTYTLVVGDAGKTVTLNNAAAVAVSLPQDSTANLPAGAVVNFYNLGAGTVTISAGAGATFQGGPLTVTQYGYAAVIKLSANTYGPFEAVPTLPGTVLLNPTSIANSGGTATNSAGAVSFTTVNSVSLNGIFSSTWQRYLIVYGGGGSTAPGSQAQMRMRASGTDATGANYYIQRFDMYGSSTNAVRTSAATTGIVGWWDSINSVNGQITILDPFAAAQTTWMGMCFSNADTGNSTQTSIIGGTHSLTTSYDGFTFLPASGTMTGTIRVYGLRN